ncbi:hypothetical protein LTR37_001172 [Vermiconidia calcicola]|uniref:Uncharacterized protein n=1 Tax=Vermiconidia calcicola TaxID=1690605 RepID=A0ACC3NX85_9PEZI|nr:hypothetical protein LTR37_001172 [Vermiconidia calcicola]
MSATHQKFNKPFTSSTPDDHRASIWIATPLSLRFVSLGVATRVYVRFKAFGTDDYVMLAACVLGLAQYCTVMGGLEAGLGESTKDLSAETVTLVGRVPRWTATATIDGVTDLCTFVAFGVFIWSLQSRRKVKITVTALLAFRLGCIVSSAIHAKYVAAYVHTSTTTHKGLAVVGALVWQQLSLSYSFLSALLIALKSFIQSFDTGYGSGENETFKQSLRSRSRNGGSTPASQDSNHSPKAQQVATGCIRWAPATTTSSKKADKSGVRCAVMRRT